MKIDFGYGQEKQTVIIPDRNLKDILYANPIEHEYFGTDSIRHALQFPIGTQKLRNLVKPEQTVVIIVSDISRPIPSYEIIPPILEELFMAGCEAKRIKVVFALGSHRNHTEEEKRKLVGDFVFENIECVDSNQFGFVHLGVTRSGTPVDICTVVAEADFIICTGNIEFHYFAGYSGGAKAIMPGVSTPAAIQKNHRMMIQKTACAGRLNGNPIREDIEEAGELCGINYIVNVVLDEHKRIVYAVAGDAKEAHRKGCEYLDKMYRKRIKEKADIVIVSQGGAPKDANLYQTQKALDNAKYAVKKGGTIILIGACPEGLGNKIFEEWLTTAPTSHSMVERIHENFILGGHKAASIAMVLENARIDLVSKLDEEFVRSIFLNPQPSAQQALDSALDRYGREASIIAMPFGGATLPYIEDNKVRER